MKERLSEWLQNKKISQSRFSIDLGKSRSWMATVGEDIPSPILAQIIKTYPDINAYWLITGEGPMYTEEAQPTELNIDDLTAKQIADITKDTLLEMFKEGEIVSGVFHRQIVAELTSRIGELEAELAATSAALERLQPLA